MKVWRKWSNRARKRFLVAVLALAAVLGGSYGLLHSQLDARFAQRLWNRGDYAAAYYLNYSSASLAMEEGDYYFGNGKYNLVRAAEAYRTALRVQPGILWGHYELGRIAFVQGKFPQAMAELTAEMNANPGNLRPLYELGLVYLYRGQPGDLSKAEDSFKKFIAWSPSEWGGYNDLAFVLAKEGQYAESERVIQEGMQKVPNGKDVAWLWNSLGVAQLNQLHYKQAQQSFETALSLAKKLTTAEWERAYTANDPSTAAQSVQNFQKAIEANIRTAQIGASL